MTSTPELTVEQASDIGTAILQAKNPGAIASPRAIRGLIETNALPDLKDPTVRAFFQSLNVLIGSNIEVVRVSLLALGASGPTDLRKYGPRDFAGVDFANTLGLSKRERRDAWTGVWPVSARNLTIAAQKKLFLLGSVRSYISPKLARVVTGSTLDLTSGLHWIESRKLTPAEHDQLFPDAATGAWISVGPGPIAAIETL